MHGSYPISRDDLRYVLCTFVVVPTRWIDELGRRRLSEHERFSYGLMDAAPRAALRRPRISPLEQRPARAAVRAAARSCTGCRHGAGRCPRGCSPTSAAAPTATTSAGSARPGGCPGPPVRPSR